MKKALHISLLLLLALLYACDDMDDFNPLPNDDDEHITETGTAELYILSEGLFNLNNSALARYTFHNNQLVPDYFRQLNQRGLGDTANHMAIYGSKLYIVVNVSSQIEVMDLASGKSLKRIPLLTDNGSSRQPRHIAFDKGKAYVCSFDGTVARIDTTSLAVEAYATVGRNPDGICVQQHKLYVSNSGGLDQPNYDNTVSVIDIPTFKEIKKITVGNNPGKIEVDKSGYVYVAVRGNLIGTPHHLVQIDSNTDEVSNTIDQPALNFAIHNEFAYLYSYNHSTKQSTFSVYNLNTQHVITENFISDGTHIETPFALAVNPYSGNVYIIDAYDYKVKGDVLCFDQQGYLQYRINNVGINPNTILFSDQLSQSSIDHNTEDPNAPSAYATRVWEYAPAPGQYMNTSTGAYRKGYSAEQVLNYATEQIKNRSLLSLGGFGGYIVLGFDHTIPNQPNTSDFKIYANANYNHGQAGGAKGGSAEPGIVLVSKDTNGNGLPDDEWYELAGSEYHSAQVIRHYEITYYRPASLLQDVQWTDNQGQEGTIPRNSFHTDNAYYPVWTTEDQLTFAGSLLPHNAINTGTAEAPNWVQYPYAWGYADNHPNNSEQSEFNIDWAVDKEGNPVQLDGIDFVKIYTAVNQVCGWMGETSTEISTIEDLHFNK